MGILEKLGLGGKAVAIDWEITPADTFGMFESWGGKERVRSGEERFYYFYIDNWEPPPRLCFMERGVKYARVLAYIEAPRELLEGAMAEQGKGLLDQSYAINEPLRRWLLENVIETEEDSKVIPADNELPAESGRCGLPGPGAPALGLPKVTLRSRPEVVAEEELEQRIRAGNFFDSRYNPAGSFANDLVDNGDQLTVTDRVTGLGWQRAGCDITAIRHVQAWVERLNTGRFAGFTDWRLPTMEEALSLLEPEKNSKELHLHPCFSAAQPFIFLADQRRPGGYWFIDFKQATVFWASGTIPGGFGRVCRG